MLQLVKTNETASREFVDGKVTERLQSVTFQIKEGENIIGNASVKSGGFSIDINRMSATVESMSAELESLFTNKTV